MFTTSPRARVRRGRASRTRARGASVFTSKTRRNVSREAFSRGGSGVSPRSEALLTSRSIRPYRFAASSSRRRSLGTLTSPGIETRGAPAASNSLAAAWRSASFLAMTIRAYPCFARKPARTRPKPRLAPVIRATVWTMAGAEFIETVERLQARPSKISFSSYKGYKTENPDRLRRLPSAVVPGIHARVVVLPGLPRLPVLVLAFHTRRDTEGAEGSDPQDDDSSRGGERDAAHEPGPQGCVGSEEHRHDRERDRACDSSRDPAHNAWRVRPATKGFRTKNHRC